LKNLFVALLTRVTDAALSDSIAGDLAEQRSRRAVRSRTGAALWFWAASAGIVLFAATSKVRNAMRGSLIARIGLREPGGQIRQAVRSLGRARWYSATVIGVIALSMALATATFSIVDGVLFKPLPFPNADELYVAGGSWLKQPSQRVALSAKDVRDWRTAHPDLGIALTTFGGGAGGGRTGDFMSRSLGAVAVSESFFDVVGVRPMLGGFQPEDFLPTEAPGAVLVTDAVWRVDLGGRPDVIGQPLTVGTRVRRVAGVLPRDFVFPGERSQPDLIYPLVLTGKDYESRARRSFAAIVRVPGAIGIAAAQARLDATTQSVMSDFPADSRLANGAFDHVHLAPAAALLTTRTRPTFLILFATSAVLVLLAALNLAGLAAARAEDRWREVTLRRALGAGAWSLVRRQFVEILVLATAGAALGVALTPVFSAATLRLLPTDLVLLKAPSIDWRVLTFAALTTVLVAVGVSIWPAIVSTRQRLAGAADQTARTTGRTGRVGRRLLVGAQVAVGLVLTIAGTLVVGSLVLLWSEDPGYSAADKLVVEAGFGGGTPVIRTQISAVVDTLHRVPGIRRVAAFDGPFLQSSTRADVNWRVPKGALRGCLAGPKSGVSGAFFDVMGLPAIAGRLPAPSELDGGHPVAAVSVTAAKHCWPDGSSPIGRTLEFASTAFTVVGVVPDVRYESFDIESRRGEVYVSNQLMPPFTTVFAVQTVGAPSSRIAGVIDTLRQAGVLTSVYRVATMTEALADTIQARRLNAWLFGIFASAALVIVAVGILGLMAMTTARRTREFGIRYALGGRRPAIVGLLLREQIVAVAAGIVAGGVIATWAVEGTKAYLYRFTPADPRLWAIAIATIAVTAMLGALIPAWRASRVDPVTSLRVE
jgi:predicted permease